MKMEICLFGGVKALNLLLLDLLHLVVFVTYPDLHLLQNVFFLQIHSTIFIWFIDLHYIYIICVDC